MKKTNNIFINMCRIKWHVYLLLLFILVFTFCQKDENESAKARPVQTVHISVNFPPGVFAIIRTHFKSVPTKFGCKQVTMVDGSFEPMKKYETDTLYEHEKEIFIPLQLKKRTLCKWNYVSTEIKIKNKAKIDRLKTIIIHPQKKDNYSFMYFKTDKPINISCKKCTNPAFDPPIEFYKCLDVNQQSEKIDDVFYYFDNIKKDTIDISVNLSFEE